MALRKELGVVGVFAVAAGAMISSGLFVLPGLAFAQAGPGVYLAYLLAAVLLLPALLSQAELSTAIPKAGGTYLYIDRSIGPGFGTLGGFANWVSQSFKAAFALIGIGAFARYFWPSLSDLEMKLVAVGFCLFFTAVNLLGARHASRSQVGIVAVLLVLLAGYIFFGAGNVQDDHFRPLLPGGVEGMTAVAAMVFISYGGLTKVASIAEEVRDPGRDLPLGMFAAYIVVSLLYVAVVYITVGVVPAEQLDGSLVPITLGGNALWPGVGGIAMTIAALLAFISTANAGILAASRTPLAMSRDALLPPAFSRVHKRRGTPQLAIVVTAIFIVAVVFLELRLFVKTASAMMILLFIFGILAVILMRESRMVHYAPKFRAPFYPWLHGFGLLAYGFMLVELGSLPLLIAVAMLFAALLWYLLYARQRVCRVSALVHLAKRIADQAFPSHDLEAELAEIVTERDRVREDEFDRLVRECPIVDLPDSPAREDLFRAVAEVLSPRLGVPPAEIERLLAQREESSSTVVRPGLAIPHIVMEGQDLFDVLLVRCKEGVPFPPEAEPVRAVFVLIGSPDQRNSHLRALMAVAEIAQHPNFDREWRAAPDADALRRLVLRAERRRQPTD